MSVQLLQEILSSGKTLINTLSLRRRVRQTAEQLEAELAQGQTVLLEVGPRETTVLPEPAPPAHPWSPDRDGVVLPYGHARSLGQSVAFCSDGCIQ